MSHRLIGRFGRSALRESVLLYGYTRIRARIDYAELKNPFSHQQQQVVVGEVINAKFFVFYLTY